MRTDWQPELAIQLRHYHMPISMTTSIEHDQDVSAFDFLFYFEKLLESYGNPKDPSEIMLIEQLAYCRLRLGNLQERAATARTLESTEAYHRMGVTLMAEFRQMVLALESYRASKGSRKAS